MARRRDDRDGFLFSTGILWATLPRGAEVREMLESRPNPAKCHQRVDLRDCDGQVSGPGKRPGCDGGLFGIPTPSVQPPPVPVLSHLTGLERFCAINRITTEEGFKDLVEEARLYCSEALYEQWSCILVAKDGHRFHFTLDQNMAVLGGWTIQVGDAPVEPAL